MKTLRFPLLVVATVATAALALTPVRATTVIPPTFDELVAQAQMIFQGTVTEVRSEWTGEGEQHHIVSYVTFRVDDAIKQAPGATYTLRMFGGTVNGETMGIADAPSFKTGDRDIVFIENNGSQFVPLVGIMYGRFHVRQDSVTGREIVTSNTGEPVTNLAALGRNDMLDHLDSPRSSATAAPEGALGPGEFKTAIRMKLGIADR